MKFRTHELLPSSLCVPNPRAILDTCLLWWQTWWANWARWLPPRWPQMYLATPPSPTSCHEITFCSWEPSPSTSLWCWSSARLTARELNMHTFQTCPVVGNLCSLPCCTNPLRLCKCMFLGGAGGGSVTTLTFHRQIGSQVPPVASEKGIFSVKREFVLFPDKVRR